jgi:hypothetical protein
MGRAYSRGSNINFLPDGQITQADSAPITRYDFKSGRTDTVAYLNMPQAQIQTSRSSGGTNVSVRLGGSAMPFVAQPAWAVAPDGRVAVVTPEPYRVTWYSPTGQRTAGEPIPYQRVRVTEAEKEAHREAFRSSPPTGISMSIDGSAGRSVSTTSVPFTEPASWPEFKHPYSSGSMNVIVAPTGELWVQKLLPFTEKNPTYDVIGGQGELAGRVVLPVGTRLLGFGANGAVYLVRRDADDLEYIQRHRLSAGRW